MTSPVPPHVHNTHHGFNHSSETSDIHQSEEKRCVSETQTVEAARRPRPLTQVSLSVPSDTPRGKPSLSRLTRDIALFSAGVPSSVVAKFPNEADEHVCAGLAVLFTGLLAAVNSAYTAATFLHVALWVACFIGLLIGSVIYNLDRMTLTVRTGIGGYIGRLMIAFILALIVSEPVKLVIFSAEIQNQLRMNRATSASQIAREIGDDPRYADIAARQNGIENRAKVLKLDWSQVARLKLLADREFRLSGTRGLWLSMNAEFRGSKREFFRKRSKFAAEDVAARSEITKRIAMREAEQADREMAQQRSEGLLARVEALEQLQKHNWMVAAASLLLTAFFLAIDTTPLFFKMFRKASSIDDEMDVQRAENRQEMCKRLDKGMRADRSVDGNDD